MRFLVSVWIVKIVKSLILVLGYGAGYAWPGKLILSFNKRVLNSSLIKFNKGMIFVTGTNGKTTTTKLISHVLTAQGFSVLSNATGGNLLNGIVSSILDGFSFILKFDYDFGVFEVDEFSLPHLLKFMEPDVLVILNLSRDQLDRHGETDIIFDRWFDALVLLQKTKLLVLEKAHKPFKSYKNIFKSGAVTFFDTSPRFSVHTSLRGSFNSGNVNAAFAALQHFGLTEDSFIQGLSGFTHAYGRGESLGKFKVFLAKNPASFNNNLQLLETADARHVLIVLNDNIPDGRDVSWIYDISADLLLDHLKDSRVYISGTRAYDMAIRLNYAGVLVKEKDVYRRLRDVLVHLKQSESLESVTVFPNYSAMLETRKILTGRSIL